MAASQSPPFPAPARHAPRLIWSQVLTAPPLGLSLAREKGWYLAWDKDNWLHLFSRSGQRQAQVRAPIALTAACCAEDGSSFAVAGSQGEVCLLAPDLMPRWQRTVPHPVTAVALDPFGQYLAAADAEGGLYVLDRLARPVCKARTPRPLHHLAFIPEAPYLMGCADFGLVACFDLTGRCAWRDMPVVHIGSLAVSGDGDRIVLACFSEGLRGYSRTGTKLETKPVPEPCRLAALSYDGHFTLIAGLSDRLHLLDRGGHTLATHQLEHPAGAVALNALGDRAAVAVRDGCLAELDLRTDKDFC
jgi:hypothetical protein